MVPFALFRSICRLVTCTCFFSSSKNLLFTGGLLGPMIIHGPANANYDIDLGPVFLTDYYHKEYFEIVKAVVEPLSEGGNPAPSSDNNLINGKMDFDCTTVAAGDTTPCTNNAGISKFKFKKGKTHRLRLINASAEGIQRFSIDGHNMTIIANDFVPIVRTVPSSRSQLSDTFVETIYNPCRNPRGRPTHRYPCDRQPRQFQLRLLDALQHLNRLLYYHSTQRSRSHLLRLS